MLNLIREIAGHERHHRAGVDVLLPSIWRRYHCPLVSPSRSRLVNISADDKLTEQVLCIFGVIPDEARRICRTPLPDAGRSGEPGSAV